MFYEIEFQFSYILDDLDRSLHFQLEQAQKQVAAEEEKRQKSLKRLHDLELHADEAKKRKVAKTEAVRMLPPTSESSHTIPSPSSTSPSPQKSPNDILILETSRSEEIALIAVMDAAVEKNSIEHSCEEIAEKVDRDTPSHPLAIDENEAKKCCDIEAQQKEVPEPTET